MKSVKDFEAERRQLTQPVITQARQGKGGLIPTQNLEISDVEWAHSDGETDNDSCVEDGDDAMMFVGRVLNTYGNPQPDVHASVEQNGRTCCAVTDTNGQFKVLVVRPERTPQGEAQLEDQERDADKNVAPAPPAIPPSHINVQLSRHDVVLLTTRLYFQDVPDNNRDAFYNGTRVIAEVGADAAKYDLVVDE